MATVKSITLAEIGSAISAGSAIIAAADALKPYVAPLMDEFEEKYKDSQDAGDIKLKSVLLALKGVATVLAVEWTSGLEAALTTLINTIKAAYNAVAELFTSSTSVAAA